MTYRKLRPEVKKTLEKIVYQLELVGKTVQLMEQRVMDSEDKLQEVMSFIKTMDLDYKPLLVNEVMSMNRFDEVTGEPLQTASPKKDFGVPLPGDPSLAYTLEKNKLAEIYGRFSNTVQLLGQHAEAREMLESRGLGQLHTTGRFQPGAEDPEQQRRVATPLGEGGPIPVYGQEGGLGMRADASGSGRSGSARLAQQPELIHGDPDAPLSINRATEADQLTNQMARLGQTAEPLNVFSTQKFSGDEA